MKWYVVQVNTGQEDMAMRLIRQAEATMPAKDQGAFDELFVPKKRTLVKRSGELVDGLESLLPGYLIAVADEERIESVAKVLQKVPKFTRLLGSDGVFTPLSEQEVAWICAFTSKNHRIIEMSQGVVEGGQVVVVSGPLVGQEALIKKVNRRKRQALLEVQIMGRKVETRVGLNLVRKQSNQAEQQSLRN